MPRLNLDTDYFTHRKTLRLVGLLGKGTAELPPRLWCYCAKFHAEDGIFSGYSEQEIESLCAWDGEPGLAIKVMVKVGFLDKLHDGYGVHDWLDHAAHIVAYKHKSQRMNEARWNPTSIPADTPTRTPPENPPKNPSAVQCSAVQCSAVQGNVKQITEPSASPPAAPEKVKVKPPPALGSQSHWGIWIDVNRAAQRKDPINLGPDMAMSKQIWTALKCDVAAFKALCQAYLADRDRFICEKGHSFRYCNPNKYSNPAGAARAPDSSRRVKLMGDEELYK